MFPLLHMFFCPPRPPPQAATIAPRPPFCVQPLMTCILDVVYQDRNISTQAISLPSQQAAQTTLYFRKLPSGKHSEGDGGKLHLPEAV